MNKIIKWLEKRIFQPNKSAAPGTNIETDSFIGSAQSDAYDDASSYDVTVPNLEIIDAADIPGSSSADFDPYDTVAKHKERSYDLDK